MSQNLTSRKSIRVPYGFTEFLWTTIKPPSEGASAERYAFFAGQMALLAVVREAERQDNASVYSPQG